eukprot:CAMPEP_0172182580 /NCGR_PEP_ID=MMETSP1050-20130122/18478_1 /TAXON_ID=233186 /ORGANISM="Cryptomonas curvata, Strain CCAP979/52" /LENGTH=697 /DNA_ID=CAMNT_0012856041 /DNA_START=843 /DNA_END=2939 /DNA_ORIENTATION=+
MRSPAAAPAAQCVAADNGARAVPPAGGMAGGHDGANDEVQIRPHSRIDTLVTTVQRNIAHGMPWRDALLLVKNSGIPIPDDTPHGDVAPKLFLAVWAAEVSRTASTVRALDDHTQQHVLAALQVDSSWSVPLQDAYIDSVLKLCRESCWALDPNLSHGLLSAARRGALAFFVAVQAQTSHQPGARAQLAAALSADEFQCLEALLTSTGRTFNDVSVAGDTWTVAAGGGSALSPVGKGEGGGTSSGWTGGASSLTSTGGLTATSLTSLRTGTMPVLALAQAEEQLLSLRFDVHALMSPKESSDLKARQKNMAAGVGDKRERSHPDAASNSDEGDLQALAQYPWNQRWKNRPSLSFVHARASVADRAHFLQRALLGQVTTLVHLGLKKDQDAIYSEFSAAAHGDASGVAVALCIIPRAMSYASSRAKAVLQDAEQQARAYPSSSLLAFAAMGRRVQEDTIGRFLDEVVKRITTEAGAASPASVTACTILMYQEFFAASVHQGGAGNTSGTPRAGGDSAGQGGGGGGGGGLGGKAADGAGTANQGQSATSPTFSNIHFSFWSQDRRSFFPDLPPGQPSGLRWAVQTVRNKDFGVVTVSFSGPVIDAVRFEEPWPRARFREGRHFVDDKIGFRLALVEGSTTVFQTTAASDGLYWAKPAWFRHFGDKVAGELEMVLDGHFCVAKSGFSMRPIYQRNHPHTF